MRSVLIVGIGNELRGDDAAGLEVARGLADGDLPSGVLVQALEGEALGLLELWDGVDAVILVDTVRADAGSGAGTVHRVDAGAGPVPERLSRTSSHTISVSEAIELARSLGRLPPEVIVFGIEGSRFEAGSSPQDAVRRASDALVEAVRREAVALSHP
jgi:hydrogenase maturation protease